MWILPSITNGGRDMHAAPSHTSATHSIIRLGVRLTPYSSGFVIAQYRSSDIAHKFNMDAVHEIWSNETQKSQATTPNGNSGNTSITAAVGITCHHKRKVKESKTKKMALKKSQQFESSKSLFFSFDSVKDACTCAWVYFNFSWFDMRMLLLTSIATNRSDTASDTSR